MVLRKFTIKVLSVFIAVSSLNFAQWEPTFGPEAAHITTITNFNNNIFCGTQTGDIFNSNDDGSSWVEAGSIEVGISEQLNSIAGNSTTLFAGTFTNLFRSTDSGITWSSLLNNIYVDEIISVNENIYAATGRGVYNSTDNGLTWQNLTANLPDTNIIAIESFGSDLFVAISGHGVYKSTNNGESWDSAKTGITSNEINFLSSDGINLYAAFSGKAEIFYSTNGGLNWNKADLIGGSSAFETVLSLFAAPSGIYAGVIFQASFFSSIAGGIYKSIDGGVTWNLNSAGLTNKYVLSTAPSGSNLLAGTQKGGIFKSTDGGVTWNPSNNGLRRADVRHIAFTNNGADFFAGVYGGGFYESNDSGKTWTPNNNSIGFSAFPTVTQFLIKGSFWFIATDGDGIFRSSDNGVTWTAVNTFLDFHDIIALIVRGTDLIAGSGGGLDGIYRSTNNGDFWTNIATGTFILGVGSLTAGGAGTIFAGAGFGSGGVIRTTNNGTAWLSSTGLPNFSVTALRFVGSKMLAGTFGEGVYISTDFGVSWEPSNTGMESAEVTFIAQQDTMNIFASTRNQGIYRSTDGAETWHQINEGLPTDAVWSIRITSSHIYAGTNGYSVWRRELSDITTDINEKADIIIPEVFILNQNYPNPFNPITTIRYSIPKSSFVILKVYDILGNEVASLVNQEKPIGNYEVKFDASRLASGIYFYQLKADGFSDTKKLILMK